MNRIMPFTSRTISHPVVHQSNTYTDNVLERMRPYFLKALEPILAILEEELKSHEQSYSYTPSWWMAMLDIFPWWRPRINKEDSGTPTAYPAFFQYRYRRTTLHCHVEIHYSPSDIALKVVVSRDSWYYEGLLNRLRSHLHGHKVKIQQQSHIIDVS